MTNNRTNKGTFKKGMSGNPNGRPKGARNKASLVKAQLTIDNSSHNAAKLFDAILSRDPEKLAEFGLDVKDVNVKAMMESAKIVLTQSASEMKALAADEKNNANNKPAQSDNAPSAPRFSAVASSKK